MWKTPDYDIADERGKGQKEKSMIKYSEGKEKQVDILISKNQALKILHLKHCVYKTT